LIIGQVHQNQQIIHCQKTKLIDTVIQHALHTGPWPSVWPIFHSHQPLDEKINQSHRREYEQSVPNLKVNYFNRLRIKFWAVYQKKWRNVGLFDSLCAIWDRSINKSDQSRGVVQRLRRLEPAGFQVGKGQSV
jgi:hypothetical protein